MSERRNCSVAETPGIVPGYRRKAVPTRAHPFVKLVFKAMNAECIKWDEFERRTGLQRFAVSSWRTRCCPSLLSIEAALGGVGLKLIVVPIGDDDVEAPIA